MRNLSIGLTAITIVLILASLALGRVAPTYPGRAGIQNGLLRFQTRFIDEKTHLAGPVAAAAAADAKRVEKAKELLPLIEGATFTYLGTFNDRESKSHYKIQRGRLGDQTPVFIWARVDDPDALVSADNFGLGAYFQEADGLYTVKVNFTRELPLAKKTSKVRLLPAEMKLGDAWKMTEAGRYETTVTFDQREDVKVPAGTFKDCVRLHFKLVWTEKNDYGRKKPDDDSYVWLSAGVGVVKWQRYTGRVEELVERKVP